MILKNAITIATLTLLGACSATSMQLAGRKLYRPLNLGLRSHCDFPLWLKRPQQRYNSICKLALNLQTSVKVIEITNDDELIQYAIELRDYSNLIERDFAPHPFINISQQADKIFALKQKISRTMTNFQYRLSNLKKSHELDAIIFDKDEFRQVLNDLDNLRETLDKSSDYIYSSTEDADLSVVSLIIERASYLVHSWRDCAFALDFGTCTIERKIIEAADEYAGYLATIKSYFNCYRPSDLNKLSQYAWYIKHSLHMMEKIETHIQNQLELFLDTSDRYDRNLKASQELREIILRNSHLYTSDSTSLSAIE
jgi:hypothetical protein